MGWAPLFNSALTEVQGAGRAANPKGLSSGLLIGASNQLLGGCVPCTLSSVALLCCSDAVVLVCSSDALVLGCSSTSTVGAVLAVGAVGEEKKLLELMLPGTAM